MKVAKYHVCIVILPNLQLSSWHTTQNPHIQEYLSSTSVHHSSPHHTPSLHRCLLISPKGSCCYEPTVQSTVEVHRVWLLCLFFSHGSRRYMSVWHCWKLGSGEIHYQWVFEGLTSIMANEINTCVLIVSYVEWRVGPQLQFYYTEQRDHTVNHVQVRNLLKRTSWSL